MDFLSGTASRKYLALQMFLSGCLSGKKYRQLKDFIKKYGLDAVLSSAGQNLAGQLVYQCL